MGPEPPLHRARGKSEIGADGKGAAAQKPAMQEASGGSSSKGSNVVQVVQKTKFSRSLCGVYTHLALSVSSKCACLRM